MAGCQWLTPVILAIQEAEIRRIIDREKDSITKNTSQKKGSLMEWLKVKVQSSSLRTDQKKKENSTIN
jgi:hypothetical protein